VRGSLLHKLCVVGLVLLGSFVAGAASAQTTLTNIAIALSNNPRRLINNAI
jgi:hypothetical protein